MPQREHRKSSPAGQTGEDFQKITGIGLQTAERLWDAGILTYEDLARHTPEEISAVTGISSKVIANRDWIGQARELARTPSDVSVQRQHYAAFYVEFLLESDNTVRGTRVRHDQTGARDTWEGWDEQRLLSFLRDRIPLPAAAPPTEVPGLESPATQATDLEPTAVQIDQPPASDRPTFPSQPPHVSPESLPPGSLSIEELISTRDGQRSYVQSPGEPNSVRLTMRLSPIGASVQDTLDFSATIAARKLGSHDRLPLGAAHGAIRPSDPLSVEVAGPALPAGLYRLVVTVDIYRAGHPPEEPPLYSQGASGDLMQVADVAPESASAMA